jgi:hypothetical protein
MSKTPLITDRVLYHPALDDRFAQISGQPLAAIVCGVWSDTCVNLAIFDANGLVQNRTSVLLHQVGNQKPTGGRWCELVEAVGPPPMLGLPVVDIAQTGCVPAPCQLQTIWLTGDAIVLPDGTIVCSSKA